MRLILDQGDQGIPRDAAIRLRELSQEATHVGEIGMSKAADREILAYSVEQQVTLDADFQTMVAVSGAIGPCAVRLPVGGSDLRSID